ncbi:MAG: methyltransferase [Chloroflexi bacterium]|nr:methyltransferase [Chloroflexota bacterium]
MNKQPLDGPPLRAAEAGASIENAKGELAPQVAVFQMLNGARVAQVVYVAAKLGIADFLRDGPKTAAQLAQLTGSDAPSLYRLLRGLASLGIFAEEAGQSFQLTPRAELLRSDRADSLRSLALFILDPYWWSSTGDMLYCVQTGQPAPPHLYGVDEWEYLAQHPETAAVFQAAMTANTFRQIPAILEAYDFSQMHTLVDIGGGQGALLAAVLRAHPAVHGVLFDRPEGLDGARVALTESGVVDRCEVVTGDMFGALPSRGDGYLLKLILHDWDDQRALQILSNIRRCMPGSSRVLLIEDVILPGNDPQHGKLLDLAMLAYNGGRERNAAEWQDLLEAAGFRLIRLTPTRASLSIIEGVPD